MGRSFEASSKMMRQHSHTSSNSNSASSPKSRGPFNIFKKRPSNVASLSREDSGSSDKIYEPNHQSDKIVSPFFQSPELEITRSSSGLPSPDSFIAAAHDTEYLRLKDKVKQLRKAPSGSDPKKVDATWDIYKKLRDEARHLCASLLHRSRDHGRNTSLDSTSIGPFDTRSSFSGSNTEPSLLYQVNEQWLQIINEYKSLQVTMLANIRASLLATYRSYEGEPSERQLQLFLTDKIVRNGMVAKWNQASIHRMKSEKLGFWLEYQIRIKNFDTLRLDLLSTQALLDTVDKGETPNVAIQECVISKHGDTILEFSNRVSEMDPVLRFRVSSHHLSEASPLFSQIFSSQYPGNNNALDILTHLPPPPTLHTCKDGMEVKVYRMPQVEPNKDDSLAIFLHAAHNHKDKVPHDIEYPTFVSLAEVCLRYRCTSPLEVYVEYIWMPQWERKIADEADDGMLLISYVFGIQGFFSRMSKSAILSAIDDDDIQSKEHWPQPIRDKIKATRAAKLAQIRECCTNAVGEYFRPPSEADRQSSVGSLQMTSMPRCPRGNHQCDATNLGWLMLVYNELQVLGSVMSTSDFPNLPRPPRRSLKELVDCLRLMPSAPQVHSGVCDYAPAFRSAINDIYNSVSGLTLRDVSGRDGWALSKHRTANDDNPNHGIPNIIELDATLSSSGLLNNQAVIHNEVISLRILSNIYDLDDLNAAAMINRTFYGAYRRNEASLLKNVMMAERRRTISSQVDAEIQDGRKALEARPTLMLPGQLNLFMRQEPEGMKYLAPPGSSNLLPPPPPFEDSGGEDLYDVSPSPSELSDNGRDEPENEIMSNEEISQILYPDVEPIPKLLKPQATNGQPAERNDKCLVGDVTHIENKARFEENKHLRDEKDKAYGLGTHKE